MIFLVPIPPHTFFAENKFTFDMIPYRYPLDATDLIGQHYLYKNEIVAANTGWLGSGYMQMGLAGMLIYAVILGLLLSLVDTIATRRDPFMSVALLFIPFITVFVSSDLPTSLLTHGLILALFLSWACRLEGHAMLKSGKKQVSIFSKPLPIGNLNTNYKRIGVMRSHLNSFFEDTYLCNMKGSTILKQV